MSASTPIVPHAAAFSEPTGKSGPTGGSRPAGGSGPTGGSGTDKRARDPRLDFFRGLAMFVIFIAHVPYDWLALWIPARFGFSDATETFVFCSGMASAIAFGAVFDRGGWLMGAARIAHRVWQVYWSHIALFVAVLALLAALDWHVGGSFVQGAHANWEGIARDSYVATLNLARAMEDAPAAFLGLLTLTYVPNYFDILPMYLVILALVPAVMALSRVSLGAVAAFCVGLWLWANLKLLGLGAHAVDLPAEPWSDREWFFNPFAWQLVFFTGFAFMRGWLPAPPVDRRLVWTAAVIVIATVPFAYFRVHEAYPSMREIFNAIAPWRDKTDFGVLRYVHFLATAYLGWVAVGPMGARIADWGRAQVVVDVIRKVGQQSLAVFLASMFLAQLAGFALDQIGRSWATMFTVNVAGFALLIATAYGVGWFKSEPWRKRPVPVRADIPGTVVPAE